MALHDGSPVAGIQNGVVVVSHDASRTGAPLIALNIARELAERRIPVVTILLRSGELDSEFGRLGPVFVSPECDLGPYVKDPRLWTRVIKKGVRHAKSAWHGGDAQFWSRLGKYLAGRRIRHAVCNTVLSGGAAVRLREAGVRSIGLIHEMPHSIRTYGWTEQCTALVRGADVLVFACPQVQAAFTEVFPVAGSACRVFPQGCNIDLGSFSAEQRLAARMAFRTRLDIAANDVLVLGAGYGDFRKGIDLFVHTARSAAAVSVSPASSRIVFAWAGQVESRFQSWVAKDIAQLGLSDRLIFLDQQSEMAQCFAAADIFFLSSREDPFPTVVLEAMASGIPAVGFVGSGGFEEQVRGGAGLAVPYADVPAVVKVLHRLAGDPEERLRMGQRGREKVMRWGGHRAYVGNLIGLLEAGPAGPPQSSVPRSTTDEPCTRPGI